MSATPTSERYSARQLRSALVAVAVCAATLMTAYESAKQLLFPDINIWQSHATTIAFTTVIAVVSAYIVGSRIAYLNRILHALLRRREAHVLRLQESQAHNEAILRSSLDCIISMDEQARITEFNPAAEKVFGRTRDEVLGQPIIDTIVPPSLRETLRERLTRYFAGGEPCVAGRRFETKGLRANGMEFPLELGLARVELPGPPTLTAFIRDLSEQRTIEQQLIRAQKMESIGRLAGGVAHDFNNLLTIILGYNSRLQQQMGTVEACAHELNGIKRAADRAAALTRQLLAFSRQQVLQPSVLDLNTVVEETKTMLARIIPERIEIAVVADPDLGTVSADRGQIEQVIVNLAVNARDAMPKSGKLTLETSNVYLDEIYSRNHATVLPGDYVMLAVSDTGVGMDEATQERIFEPFFTTKDVGKGTGLGLSSVYGIVRQSGGYIWVYSEPGQGTIFKIYLPRVQTAASAVTQQKKAISFAPSGTETILLVEDNRELRELAESALTSHGYTVLAAEDPRAAEQLAAHHQGRIDLLLSDVVMPEMSGMELAQRLQASRKEMKVFYVSGYTDNMVMRRDGAGSDAIFLQKPFAPSVLLTKLREVLDRETNRAAGISA